MPQATFLTVSRAAATRVNRIVMERLFEEDTPLTAIPPQNETANFLPYKNMRTVVTQNVDKRTGVKNGQEATILNNHANTMLLQFPNGHKTFTHPITTVCEDEFLRVHYLLNPAYAMTICKTQGANIRQLVVWFDLPVPKGMGYNALSRVRKSDNIRLLTPINNELTPASN